MFMLSLMIGCSKNNDKPELELVNFDYVLLGKYTKADMNDNIIKYVYKGTIIKRVVYKIEKNIVPGPESGGGFGIIYSFAMNWIKISKPENDYKPNNTRTDYFILNQQFYLPCQWIF